MQQINIIQITEQIVQIITAIDFYSEKIPIVSNFKSDLDDLLFKIRRICPNLKHLEKL